VHAVDVLTEAGATIVSATGELDLYAKPDLERALHRAAQDGAAVVVDLGAVSFMDSTALGALVHGVRELDDAGRGVRVVLPRGTARRVFELTTVDRVLPVAESRADAIASVSRGPTPG
jgi:anti-sigma B factor antagonist